VQSLAVVLEIERVAMKRDPDLVRKEIPHPEIMVARNILYFDTTTDQIAQPADHLMVVFRDGVFVLEPEIK